MELVYQANERDLRIDHLLHATGSCGTQASLVVGLKAMNAHIPLMGITVRLPKAEQEEIVYNLAQKTAEKIGCPGVVARDDVTANSDYVGEGYGIPAPSTLAAIDLFARLEGILLDPVYSGKCAAGLIDLCRKGFYEKTDRAVFLHTGGSTALFAYLSSFGTSAPR